MTARKKNPAAVALGRLGGKKGGAARAAKLTAERRTAIAKAGAKARWGARAAPADGRRQNERRKHDVGRGILPAADV